jgi:hypothetical protein
MRVYEKDPEFHYTVFGNSVQIKEQCEHWKMVEHKERLEAACEQAYQVVGLIALEDSERFKSLKTLLDNLLAAMNNRPLPHSDVLPWSKKS